MDRGPWRPVAVHGWQTAGQNWATKHTWHSKWAARRFGHMVTECNLAGSFVSQVLLLLKTHLLSLGFSLCLLPPHSYFFALILKNWLHTQLGLAWFLSQIVGLAPFPTGHCELQVSCTLMLTLFLRTYFSSNSSCRTEPSHSMQGLSAWTHHLLTGYLTAPCLCFLIYQWVLTSEGCWKH